MSSEHETSVVEAYGKWVASASRDWPGAALESAHRQLIDTIAVSVPGAIEPSVSVTLETVLPWGEGTREESFVVGTRKRLAPPWAALVNGTAAHALDFDDNYDPPKAHASAVLYPAILALADTKTASGMDVLDAFIVGLQIMGRVGQGVNPTHRNRGWHATSSVGVFGAAAACARLLKLDASRCAHALSLASSMSSGFMSQFGTMTKPLHAGLAARGGVMAAGLAEKGMQAGRYTLNGPTGMNTLMVGPDREQLKSALTGAEHGQTLEFETETIGEPLQITTYGFRVKRFPNCGSAHRAMDILLDIMERNQLKGTDIAKIEVHAPKTHLDNLFYHDPVTPLEAKFSMQYALACLLETGYAKLQDFTEAAVGNPSIRAHFKKIELYPVDKPESEFPTRLFVHVSGGECLEGSASMPRGSIESPFSNDEYWEKFEACTGPVLQENDSAALRQALESFPELSASTEMTRYYGVDLSLNN